MNKQSKKLLKQSIFSGLLIFLILFLLLTLFKIWAYSFPGPILHKLNRYFISSEFIYNLMSSLLISIPLVVSTFFGKKTLKTNQPKKIFYKMPLHTLIPSFIMSIVFIFSFAMICKGEGCIGITIISFYIPLTILGIALLSLLFATYYYFTRGKAIIGKIIKIIAIIIIIIELIYIISSLIYSSYLSDPLLHYCGPPEKGDYMCYTRHATENNDDSICEKLIVYDQKKYCYDQFSG